MRKIKFRVWDTNNKEILELEELNYEYGEPAIRTKMYTDYFEPSDMILMQYTGLHDKNGKEIYEGDIVAIEFQRACKRGKAVIRYDDKYASFVIKNTGEIAHENENLGDYQMENFEVIGNIYENKNLLEEKIV